MGISFKPEGILGLYLTPQQLQAGLYRWQDARLKPDWVRSEPLNETLFTQPPGADAGNALQETLAGLWREAGNPYVTVQLALSDTVGHVALYDFETLPGRAREADALVRMRLAKDFNLQPATTRISYRVMSEPDQPPRVLTVAMDRAWLEVLQRVMGQLHLPLTCVDLHCSYRLAHARRANLAGPAAWLQVEDQAWSLIIFDADHNPVYIKNRACPDGVRIPVLAEEVKRILLSLSLGQGRLDCTRLYHNLPPQQCAEHPLFADGQEDMACHCLDGPEVSYAAAPRDETVPT